MSRCDKPTRDDAYVCDDDLDDFAKALGDVPWLSDELDITITKQRAATGGDGVRSAACSCADGDDKCQHALVLFHVKASECADRLREQMALLARHCREDGVRSSDPSNSGPANNLVSLSRWLLWRVDGLAFNDMAAEFIADVLIAVRDCRRVIDLPPERAYAGPCPECKRDLYHRPAATEAKCPGCGQVYDVAEVQAWMQDRIREHMTDRLVTSHEGATLLGRMGLETPQREIGRWHERGLLPSSGNAAGAAGGRERRLYRFDDLLRLAARKASA